MQPAAPTRIRRSPGLLAFAAASALGVACWLGVWGPPSWASLGGRPACGAQLLARARRAQVFAAWEGGGILEGAPDYKSRLVFPSDQEARAHMRHEFRYEGPMPSPADLACFLANDKACAFFHCLQESHHKIVVEELRPVEVELGRLAYEFDLELQRARLQLRGTDGEIVLRRDAPDRAARKYDIEGRRKQANASQEWWTVVNGSGQDTWYHITREQFPRLFELRASEQQTRELRERLLEDRMRDILLREGVGALNPARFVRS